MSELKPVKLAFISAEPKNGCSPNLCPVILHHGMSLTKERWQPILQKLADDSKRKVYSVDARNHGESERSDVFNFRVLAEDLEHFMSAEGIEKAVIIGHSMGGWVAMSMALLKPDKVEKIIVEDSSPNIPPELLKSLAAMLREQAKCMRQLSLEDSEEYVQQQIRECIYRTVSMISDREREFLEKTKFPIKKTEAGYEHFANLDVIASAIENFDENDLNFTGVYNGDAVFIYGGKSFMNVFGDKENILQLFPKAEFYGFDDGGHELLTVYPDEYISKVLKVLQQ